MFEMRQETDYVNHHIQKIIAFFKAMRSFAERLQSKDINVIYYKIGDKENKHDLTENITKLIEAHGFERFEYLLPDEYRLDRQLANFCESLNIDSQAYDTEHFLCERKFLKEFFKGKKSYLMESFYRHIRKKFDILIEGDGEPVGGQWNYDHDNRKSLAKNPDVHEFITPTYEVQELIKEIDDSGVNYIGNVDPEKFIWPTDRASALEALNIFLEKALQDFGRFQDAMHTDYKFLYHSRLSFPLNAKLISPIEVVETAIEYWKKQDGINIAQIEGFVRQIIGWREYMRGVYWAHMPDYANMNYFENNRSLPEWYWTGETKMNCMHHAIQQSLDEAYAHHIQRLMVTGNFALLAGVDPDAIDAWYLGIYIDAIEWVEITNTRGMSQFADGGIVGTKPYISSASYINKMSNYCSDCYYKCKVKTGEKACPFNSLYWHFYSTHRDKLQNNPRVAMMYRVWEKMGAEKQTDLLDQAELYLSEIENL